MTLRKSSRGFVLSCSNYSAQTRCAYTIWLPKEARSITVVNDETCPNCTRQDQYFVRRIKFEWKTGSVPPHMGRDCIVCVLCDADFRNEMQVSLPHPNQVISNPTRRRVPVGRGGARTAGTRERQRPRGANNTNNGTGNACYRCGKQGHYANACPQTA